MVRGCQMPEMRSVSARGPGVSLPRGHTVTRPKATRSDGDRSLHFSLRDQVSLELFLTRAERAHCRAATENPDSQEVGSGDCPALPTQK